jgi:DNA-binding transcriptional LysR family regulator
LDTRSLLYFIAVAEEGNVGRAAARLHITQPALTRQIHSLEDEVGVPLFMRTSAGMEITTAGTVLLRHARAIQAELTQARLNARQAEGGERQALGVAVFGSAVFNVMPRLLARFASDHPRVELCLHHVRKDQQLSLLRQGEIQIAFDRFLPREADMAYEVVYRENLMVVLHEDHPLAAKETIDVGELSGETCVGAAADAGIEARLSQVFGTPMPRVAHRADGVLTVLTLVSAGLCVGFAPPSMRAVGMPSLAFRPLSGAKVPFDVVCMYCKGDRSAPLAGMLATVRAFRAASEKESPPRSLRLNRGQSHEARGAAALACARELRPGRHGQQFRVLDGPPVPASLLHRRGGNRRGGRRNPVDDGARL